MIKKRCDGLVMFVLTNGSFFFEAGSAAAPTASARRMTGRLTTAVMRIVVVGVTA